MDGVLLRTIACGICGTDVRSYYNGDRRISGPWILGHEISGEVVAVGSRASLDGVGVGDHVHCISTFYCGECRFCRAGNENICPNGQLMGFDYPGGFAQYVAVPAIGIKNLFSIPDSLDPVTATLGDPLSDVICGHKDLSLGPDAVVVVIGAGPIGTAHAAIARKAGAALILILEQAQPRLELARDVLGGDRVAYVDVAEADPVAAVRAETGGDGADVVIVACSSPSAQEQSLEMAAPRGRVLFFGGLPRPIRHIRFRSNVVHYAEIQVHGSYASRRIDQVAALEMLARGEENVRALISRVVPLAEAPDAFRAIRDGDALKVVVRP